MKKLLALVMVVVLIVAASFGMTGKEVLTRVKDAHKNFTTEKSAVTMKLVESNGSSKTRDFDMYIYKKGDNTFAMVRFNAPADVKDTTLLTLSDDEIYLYMPAFKSVKRISGGAKNGQFVGSDLKYSDISLLYNEQSGDYDAKILKEDVTSWTVEIDPKGSDSDYAKIVATINKKDLLLTYAEFYNKSNEKIKTMEFAQVKSFGTHTLATHIELTDLKTKHSTIVDINKVEFDISGLTEKFFNKNEISKPVLSVK